MQGSHSRAPSAGDTAALDIESCTTPISMEYREPIYTHQGNVTTIQKFAYHPPGVTKIIGRGGVCWIGLLDDSTVLNYPDIRGNLKEFHTEAKIFEALGSHPRIIGFRGLTEHGIILQRAANGSLAEYVASQPTISLDRRLHWCKQALEAVSFIHTKNVIHCDINPRNFLLDENLDLLLADFQGVLKSPTGETLLDGLARESTKAYLPRDGGSSVTSVKTDIFALGCTIYSLMTGHEVFPDLDHFEDEEEIESRFRDGLFPTDSQPCFAITEKCWNQQYLSADEILHDLSLVGAVKSHVE